MKKTNILNQEESDIKLESECVEQVDRFKCVGSYIKEDMLCTKEINVAITIGKGGLNRKRKSSYASLNKELRKALAKCYVRNVAMYVVETWTLSNEDERRIEAREMWILEKMAVVTWVDKLESEAVLTRTGKRQCQERSGNKSELVWAIHEKRLSDDGYNGKNDKQKGREKKEMSPIDE